MHSAQHSLPSFSHLSAGFYCPVTLLLFIFLLPILLISFSPFFICSTSLSFPLSVCLSDSLFLTMSSRLCKQERGNVLWGCLSAFHPVCLQRKNITIHLMKHRNSKVFIILVQQLFYYFCLIACGHFRRMLPLGTLGYWFLRARNSSNSIITVPHKELRRP